MKRETVLRLIQETCAEIGYRPGYEGPFVEVWGDADDEYRASLSLSTVDTDAYHPDDPPRVFPWEGEEFPETIYEARTMAECRREIVEFVFASVCRAAVHDVCEWFTFRDRRVFDPHSSNEDRGLTASVQRFPWTALPSDVAELA